MLSNRFGCSFVISSNAFCRFSTEKVGSLYSILNFSVARFMEACVSPRTFLPLFLLSAHKTHRSYLLWQTIYSPIFSLLILHDDVNGNRIALLYTDNPLLLLRKLFSSLIFLLVAGYHRSLRHDFQ